MLSTNSFNNAIEYLKQNSCASIQYRIRKELLNEPVEYKDYEEAIISDKKVQTAFSWQKDDGYLGVCLHGGWIPENKKIKSTQGMETALRLLSDMGVPKEDPVVAAALESLLRDDFNRWGSSWDLDLPEYGLYGSDYERAILFARFGVECHDFIGVEVEKALGHMKRLAGFNCLDDFCEPRKNFYIYRTGYALPEIYHLRLLARTKSWRTEENLGIVVDAMTKLVGFTPLPSIYAYYENQKIAPAKICNYDLNMPLSDMDEVEWYLFFSFMELMSLLGMIQRVPAFKKRIEELAAILEENDGLFIKELKHKNFKVWGCYQGLMLEPKWSKKNMICDLTFRSLLIMKDFKQ